MANLAQNLSRRNVETIDSYVWLGLDFGTATTECVARVETAGREDRVYVIAGSGSTRQDAAVVMPSATEIDGDWMRAGVSLTGRGKLYDNIKLDIIREVTQGRTDDELFKVGRPCYFAVLHLAEVIATCKQALYKRLLGETLRYYINIAAPIGPDAEDARYQRLRSVVHAIADRANELSDAIGRWPVRVADAQQAYRRLQRRPAPDARNSPIFVVPEALAAVTAFLQAPNRRADKYATVDIGGGSTDVSFFWFQNGDYAHGEKKAWYYSVQTELVGMSMLFDGLTDALTAQLGRTRHERLRDVKLEQHEQIVGEVLQRVTDCYNRAFSEAFKLVPRFDAEWRCSTTLTARWDLLLLGGGCFDRLIREKLARHTPSSMIEENREVESLGAPSELDVLLPDGEVLSTAGQARSRYQGGDPISSVSHLLTVAYGLSFRALDIPLHGVEHAVDPPPPPPAYQPPRTTYDVG